MGSQHVNEGGEDEGILILGVVQNVVIESESEQLLLLYLVHYLLEHPPIAIGSQ